MNITNAPAARRPLPYASVSIVASHQFNRSASASNGDALACIPFSPVSGLESRPRAS